MKIEKNKMSLAAKQSKKSEAITLTAVKAASQLFKDSNSKSFRTPISLLQEICTKSLCASPTYELLDTEGKVHQPTFVYKCTLNHQVQAIGKSNTKKKAKHLAALGILNQIRLDNIETENELSHTLEELITSLNDLDLEENPSVILSKSFEQETKQMPFNENGVDLSNIQVSCEGNLEEIKESVAKCENPVGELIEIANKFSMRPPEFDYGDEEGPPHNRQFLCSVKFGDFRESSSARTKKLAKKYAALRLLFCVKASGLFNKTESERHEEINQDLSYAKSSLNKKYPVNIFNQLKNSKNPTINNILSNDLESVSCLTLFDKLSKEEKFNYEIYSIPTSSEAKVFAVDVKTSPHLTYGGYGSTKEEAISQAIFYTLNHIKVMCSRGKIK